ncbi:MAG: glycosyltransferase family 2 protein [Bacteroidales bacterium]|nr:glycosyltransferase family 2 protein [Bacteroidales bacterium]MBN2757705.1 glycosyltransferase family 2 protein [Bacteroidales bacterium]
MERPKVTVLILSYNGKELLKDSVSSYLANDYPNFEVAIIDNGSIDGTKEFVEKEFPKAKVVRLEKNRGYSGGFNFGLEYAFDKMQSKYAIITNNDVKADSKALSELVKVAEMDEMNGFVTGKVYYFYQPDTLQTVGKKEDAVYWNGGHIGSKEKDEGQYEEIAERYFADDIYTLVSKKMYDEVGAYDTNFLFQSEEYDWQARAKEKGFKIMYSPGSKIWHKESMTIGKQSAFKAFFDARNPMIVVMKYKSPEFFKRYFWQHFKKDIFRNSLVRIKKFRLRVAWSIWMGFFSGLIWGFKNKKLSFKHFF